MNHEPFQSRKPSMKRMAAYLLIVVILSTLPGCNAAPTPTAVSLASPVVANPTATETISPTATPTRTSTPTAIVTASATASSTSTATSTPSGTPSRTATPTLTPSPTLTLTPTDTGTPTNTPGPPSPTITPTVTITPTPSPTLTPTPQFTPTPMPTLALSDDVVNILLIGLDSRSNLRGQNTDVIIVVGVNKDTKQVTMLSIPRDLWVYIPTYGWSRINQAHRRGYASNYPGEGPGLLMDTIEVNFGLPIDHWARIDFEGFARVVDELGGVDMTVACPVNLRYRPPSSDTEEEMLLEPGIYHMDGATALRYVRTRRGGSDFDRSHRQHQFLKAMWDQTKSPDLLLKIPRLWSALSDSVETDLKLGDILSLAPVALDLEPQRIRSRYIGPAFTTDWTTHEGWQVLLPQYDRIQQLIANLYAFGPTSEDEVARENARIQVRNGTYRHQLAQIAADQLRWYGLNVIDTGLADNPDYQETQIVVFNDKPKAVEKLSQVLAVAPRNVIYQPDPNQPADVLVILGVDYDPCR